MFSDHDKQVQETWHTSMLNQYSCMTRGIGVQRNPFLFQPALTTPYNNVVNPPFVPQMHAALPNSSSVAGVSPAASTSTPTNNKKRKKTTRNGIFTVGEKKKLAAIVANVHTPHVESDWKKVAKIFNDGATTKRTDETLRKQHNLLCKGNENDRAIGEAVKLAKKAEQEMMKKARCIALTKTEISPESQNGDNNNNKLARSMRSDPFDEGDDVARDGADVGTKRSECNISKQDLTDMIAKRFKKEEEEEKKNRVGMNELCTKVKHEITGLKKDVQDIKSSIGDSITVKHEVTELKKDVQEIKSCMDNILAYIKNNDN